MFNLRIACPAVFLIILLFSCTEKKQAPQAGGRSTGPLRVDGFIVEQQTVSEKVEVPGTLLPAEETQIRAEVSGRITTLNLDEGKVVQKGALLVKLFDEDLQAQLRKLQVQLEIAQKTEERQKELLAINGISQQDYDLSNLQVENLKADIQTTRIAISKTEIRAPYTGKVGLRNVSPGAFLSPTDIIATIRQVESLKLEFSIPEKYAREVSNGSRISFVVDGGTEMHNATVIATESGIDQATRTLRVRARVVEKHRELVPGVFARVSLQLGKDSKALLVPTQSVIPQARGKKIILARGDSAVFVDVTTGVRDSVFVQILTGVKQGDTVVTTGLMAIRPQAKIRIARVARYSKN